MNTYLDFSFTWNVSFTDLPLKRSTLVGSIAYLVGFVFFGIATMGTVDTVLGTKVTGEYADPTPLGQILVEAPSDWIVSGWLYYNAHFVPTSLPTADAQNGFATLTNLNFLNEIGGILLAPYLIPPLLLICAGYVVARTSRTSGVTGERNAGASITLGYFPLFLAGAFFLTAKAGNSPAVGSPDGLQTIFFGLLFPLLFGAIGGAVAERRSDDSENHP